MAEPEPYRPPNHPSSLAHSASSSSSVLDIASQSASLHNSAASVSIGTVASAGWAGGEGEGYLSATGVGGVGGGSAASVSTDTE